jgi:hypothetical protein
VIVLGLFLGLNAWFTDGRKPVTESESEPEIEKLTAGR